MAVIAAILVPAPALAHNVTFRATVTVLDDGQAVEVYIDDVIRNPVPDADVTVTGAAGSASLTESDPGRYVGTLPRPVKSGDRLTLDVAVGSGKYNIWRGSGRAEVGGETAWVLTHQHGIDGRTFSIVMTTVFGALLAVIAVHEAIRWQRRRKLARSV